jgi:hypothetical protein
MRLVPVATKTTSPTFGDMCIQGTSGNAHLYVCLTTSSWTLVI